MRRVPVFLLVALVGPLSGCLTTYYDAVTWTDPGLADALRTTPPEGWEVRNGTCGIPCVVATRAGLEVIAPDPPAPAPGVPRSQDPGEGRCRLGRQGTTTWSDAELQVAVDDLYAALRRPAPQDLSFSHMHGD